MAIINSWCYNLVRFIDRVIYGGVAYKVSNIIPGNIRSSGSSTEGNT